MSYRFKDLQSVQRQQEQPLPAKRRKGGAGGFASISSLANKFEAPEVREARRKKEEEEVRRSFGCFYPSFIWVLFVRTT